MVNIGNDWDDLLSGEWKRRYYIDLREFLKYEYQNFRVHPQMGDIFNALSLTSYKDTRAVILGQDPYHEPGQAHGLCFSVKRGVKPPPSLQNIYKELENDLGQLIPIHGDLTGWSKSGVLLLNTVLTVREGFANSHKGKGWEYLTDRVIELLNQKQTSVAFILWGANARAKTAFITNPIHKILTAAHPSPLSAHNGFFGCRHFSKTNDFLRSTGQKEIEWGAISRGS
ncbi:MAG: uracil-DNA glycosylase [Eubacterium sp.]|jgi:uracil-DNA glycosylase|nr:uracil-DNA glycosylase [Eubacterium sp.]